MRTRALGSTGMNISLLESSGGSADAIGGALERRDVEALHVHHRLEGAPGAGAIGVAEQCDELARHDLPRNTEAIFYPAALLGFGHRRERVGDAVGLGLGLHGYLEGDRLVELERRSAIQTGERPT